MNEKKLLKKIENLRLGISRRTAEKKNYPKIIYDKLPEIYRAKLENEADYAGIKNPIHNYVINIMKVTAVAELFALIVLIIFFKIGLLSILAYLIVGVGVDFLVPYGIVSIIAEHNKRSMEKVLPDFLTLAAANIRSGQTIEKALLFSARDEFGPLSKEVKKTALKIYGGVPINDALFYLSDRVKSFTFKRTINLVTEGLRSGGNIAIILDESAADIQNTRTLLKEVTTSVQMMVMFIFIAGVLASPAMFAISNYLVVKTSSMWGSVDSSSFEGASAGGGLMTYFKYSESSITPEFFNDFSMRCILITCFFGGLIVSQIKTGNIKDAVKYIPFFSIVAIGIYLALRMVLFSVLGVV